MTRQRTALLAVIEEQTEFRSAQDVHRQLRDRGETVGLATVYRGLQALAEAGRVDVLRNADGENLFRQCAREEHHHHLVCRFCGRTQEIDGPLAEAWASKIGAEHGFSQIEHVIELFGTCTQCALDKGSPAVET